VAVLVVTVLTHAFSVIIQFATGIIGMVLVDISISLAAIKRKASTDATKEK
jgi:hypothetical protein